MGAYERNQGAAALPRPLTMRLSLFGRRHNLAAFVFLAPIITFLLFVLVLPIGLMAEMSLYQRGQAGTIIKVMSLAPDSSTASWAALRSDCPITLGSPFWVRGRIAPTRTGPVPTVSPTAAPPPPSGWD